MAAFEQRGSSRVPRRGGHRVPGNHVREALHIADQRVHPRERRRQHHRQGDEVPSLVRSYPRLPSLCHSLETQRAHVSPIAPFLFLLFLTSSNCSLLQLAHDRKPEIDRTRRIDFFCCTAASIGDLINPGFWRTDMFFSKKLCLSIAIRMLSFDLFWSDWSYRLYCKYVPLNVRKANDATSEIEILLARG